MPVALLEAAEANPTKALVLMGVLGFVCLLFMVSLLRYGSIWFRALSAGAIFQRMARG